jgi:hypothetical protein
MQRCQYGSINQIMQIDGDVRMPIHDLWSLSCGPFGGLSTIHLRPCLVDL